MSDEIVWFGRVVGVSAKSEIKIADNLQFMQYGFNFDY
jgi:hypothetical protein